MTEQSTHQLDRDVIAEALELMNKHSDSPLWLEASDEMCADYSLAAALLRGELDGEHVPAAIAASEVLPRGETNDRQTELEMIPCGCGDYEIHIDETEHIRELDVICPECKNHFGWDVPDYEHREVRGTHRD